MGGSAIQGAADTTPRGQICGEEIRGQGIRANMLNTAEAKYFLPRADPLVCGGHFERS